MKKTLAILMCAATAASCLSFVGCEEEQPAATEPTAVYTLPSVEPTTIKIDVDGLSKLEKGVVYALAKEVDEWVWNDITSFKVLELAGYSESLGSVYVKYQMNDKKGKPKIDFMKILIDSEAEGAELYTPYMNVTQKQFDKVKKSYKGGSNFNIIKINKSLREHLIEVEKSY